MLSGEKSNHSPGFIFCVCDTSPGSKPSPFTGDVIGLVHVDASSHILPHHCCFLQRAWMCQGSQSSCLLSPASMCVRWGGASGGDSKSNVCPICNANPALLYLKKKNECVCVCFLPCKHTTANGISLAEMRHCTMGCTKCY